MITIFSLLTIDETKATAKVPLEMYTEIMSILNQPFIELTIGELVRLTTTPIFDHLGADDLFSDLYERFGKEGQKRHNLSPQNLDV